jgi:hypothetical protein
VVPPEVAAPVELPLLAPPAVEAPDDAAAPVELPLLAPLPDDFPVLPLPPDVPVLPPVDEQLPIMSVTEVRTNANRFMALSS